MRARISANFFADETKEILPNEAGNARKEREKERDSASTLELQRYRGEQRTISRKAATARRDFVYLIDNAPRKRWSGRKGDTRGRVVV